MERAYERLMSGRFLVPKRRPIVVAALPVAVVAGVLALASHNHVSAASVTGGGWTTSGQVTPTGVAEGSAASITARVSSSSNTQALVDVEVYNPNGAKVGQTFWQAQSFMAGTARTSRRRGPLPAPTR